MSELRRPQRFEVPLARQRLSSLGDGPVLVDGVPFSGIGYVPAEGTDRVYAPVRLVGGELQEDLADPVLPDGIFIDLSEQADGIEAIDSLFGEPLTGMVLRFERDGDRVAGCDFYMDGEGPLRSYTFDESGLVNRASVLSFDDAAPAGLRRLQQSVRYGPSGAVRSASTIFTIDDDGIGGSFSSKDGRLSRVIFQEGYFELVERYDAELSLPAAVGFEFLDSFSSSAERLALGLGDRSSELVSLLIDRGLLAEVSTLEVTVAPQSLTDFQRLLAVELPALESLDVRVGSGLSASQVLPHLVAMKRQNVDRQVSLERMRMCQAADEWSGQRTLIFDRDFNGLLGAIFYSSVASLVPFASEPSLKFVRCKSERAMKELDELLPGLRRDSRVEVYGPDLDRETWIALARKRLAEAGELDD